MLLQEDRPALGEPDSPAVAFDGVADIDRRRRHAYRRVDALARLRAAMTPDERIELRWLLDLKEAALLRDLGRLEVAAVTTAFPHVTTNERSSDGHPCTTT